MLRSFYDYFISCFKKPKLEATCQKHITWVDRNNLQEIITFNFYRRGDWRYTKLDFQGTLVRMEKHQWDDILRAWRDLGVVPKGSDIFKNRQNQTGD